MSKIESIGERLKRGDRTAVDELHKKGLILKPFEGCKTVLGFIADKVPRYIDIELLSYAFSLINPSKNVLLDLIIHSTLPSAGSIKKYVADYIRNSPDRLAKEPKFTVTLPGLWLQIKSDQGHSLECKLDSETDYPLLKFLRTPEIGAKYYVNDDSVIFTIIDAEKVQIITYHEMGHGGFILPRKVIVDAFVKKYCEPLLKEKEKLMKRVTDINSILKERGFQEG